jgi:hypothetical protein
MDESAFILVSLLATFLCVKAIYNFGNACWRDVDDPIKSETYFGFGFINVFFFFWCLNEMGFWRFVA